MSSKPPSKEQCLRDAESMRAELGHMRAAWEGAEQRAKDAREEALRQAEALFDPRTLSIHHEAWLAVMRGGRPIPRDADLAREREAREQAEARAAALETAFRRLLAIYESGAEVSPRPDWITAALSDPASALATHDAAVRAEALREEGTLRRLLWLRHGCEFPALYGDDGEMQCNTCMIDFKRSAPADIESRFVQLAALAGKGAG